MVKHTLSYIFQIFLFTFLAYILCPDVIHALSEQNTIAAPSQLSIKSFNGLQSNDYCIEGRVWQEDDNNTNANEENGIDNIRIHLYSHTGEEIGDTLTDETGHFKFKDLRPGPYNIQFIRKFGYRFTGPESEISLDPAKEFQNIDSSPCSDTIPLDASLVVAPRDTNGIEVTELETIELKIEYQPSYPPAMKISWVTSMEVNLEGFHIHRSHTGNRIDASRVTQQRIDGRGQGERERINYEYIDYDIRVSTDIIYSYWLTEEEKGTDKNHLIDHGPVHETIFAVDFSDTQIYLPLIMK